MRAGSRSRAAVSDTALLFPLLLLVDLPKACPSSQAHGVGLVGLQYLSYY